MITFSENLLFEFQASSRMSMSLREFRRKVVPFVPSTLMPMAGAAPQPAWSVRDLDDWAARQTSGPKRGVVYFLEAVGTDRVKIGWSTALASRLPSIRCGCPVELRLLGTINGVFEDEGRTHALFAEARIWPNAEWFRLSPAILHHIETHADCTGRTIDAPGAWGDSRKCIK